VAGKDCANMFRAAESCKSPTKKKQGQRHKSWHIKQLAGCGRGKWV